MAGYQPSERDTFVRRLKALKRLRLAAFNFSSLAER